MWKSVSITSMVRILGLIGSGEIASARSGAAKSGGRDSFMAVVLRTLVARGCSSAQDHLIAAEPHFVGSKFFRPVQAMLPGGEIERPIVPRAADHLALGDEITLAYRGAFVDA